MNAKEAKIWVLRFVASDLVSTYPDGLYCDLDTGDVLPQRDRTRVRRAAESLSAEFFDRADRLESRK